MAVLFTPLSLLQLIDQFQPIAMRPYAGANLDDHSLRQQLIVLQRLISKLIGVSFVYFVIEKSKNRGGEQK